MIEEHGRVVSVEKRAVWIETARKSTCSSCSAKSGCGQHLIEKYRNSNSHSYIRATINHQSVEQGGEVIIGIPENTLMKASMLVYLLPLLAMMLALWGASARDMGDLVTVALALLGLGLGFVPVRLFGQKAGDLCGVSVMRTIPRHCEPELITVTDLTA